MKKQLSSFLAGAVAAALIGTLTVSALAATGRMTIEVDPINIQVNGKTFQPTDVNGDAVPVFAYNGTTYAPLRALAEAYGLAVRYDAATNMATVMGESGKESEPVATAVPTATPKPDTSASAPDYSDWSAEDEAAYQEFKGLWEIEYLGYRDYDDGMVIKTYCGTYKNHVSNNEARAWYKSFFENIAVDDFDFNVRLAEENRGDEDITVFYLANQPDNGVGLCLSSPYIVLPIGTRIHN